MKRLYSLFQILHNMGLRYVLFRTLHEVQVRTGLLRQRFPIDLPAEDFTTLAAWQASDTSFFFDKPFLEKAPFALSRPGSLIKRVKELQKGKLLFFGSTWYTVTDWLTNPKTGYRYNSTQHWTTIPDLSPEAGDIKYVWEKSRFTFLYDLIRYDFHQKEDQSELVFSEIENWIEANPVNCGPNWRCSQEITLRVLNWTFALHYYKTSPQLTEERFSRILNSLYRQMQHVEENIHFSRIAVRNNHALTETLGLYLVGMLYPFFQESTRWKEQGKRWFEEEVGYQIYQDGTFLQFSMNYHRVVVQLLTWAIQLAHRNGERWSEIVYDRARKSLQFLRACQDDRSGWLPNSGNNDGALFFPLSECHFRDYRPQLYALATTLGEDLNYGHGTWKEEAFWLAGQPSTRKAARRSSKGTQSHAFHKGGYYILRDHSTLTFLRCGSYQDRPFQADNLHLDIWVNGQNVLRDAGSYQYNTDEELIRYFAGTASHNTIMLDEHDQMRKGPRFIWYDWIRRAGGEWKENGESTMFRGWFQGYSHLSSGIIHTRNVTKVTGQLHWIIEDEILNAPTHLPMHQLWHPSEAFFDTYEINAYTSQGEPIPPIETEGWYSGLYGTKTATPRLAFTTTERYIQTEIRVKS
ncbi:heparinase II/III family protein [Telluribacter humicola]|uniref:heparinase II/III family protein n=1 Tax=Telluribacter humicola TaxID=1720261 RepID=UPI001A95843C|nr:alginate lyase family protein [Telluribacter humicola]